MADALATPRDADPELQVGEGRTSVLAGGHREEIRKVNSHLADGDRTHAAAPRFCKSDEGGGVERGLGYSPDRKIATSTNIYMYRERRNKRPASRKQS
jgi:hypothetical protein